MHDPSAAPSSHERELRRALPPGRRRPTRLVMAAWLLACGCHTAQAPETTTPPPDAGDGTRAAEAPRETSPAAPASPATPAWISSAVSAPDRSEEDRSLDEGRHPAETLAFFQIRPDMSVAELAAGMGYTAELLARVVGPGGKVYGQNTPFILQRFAEGPWSERLQKSVMKNVVRVDSELEAPLPEEASNLDAVLLILFYHDTVWFETDRAKMNSAIFDALRPGGVYGIVDHSARPGDGTKEAQTLHRIEESVLRAEVEAAGFILEDSAAFLRNPDDTRDWSASPSKAGERRGTSDRFVLRFRKPE